MAAPKGPQVIARVGSKLLGLSGPVLAWAAIAAGTLIAALCVTVWLQHKALDAKSEQIGACGEREKHANRKAESNKEAAVHIAARLTQCVQGRALDLKAERAANATLERRLRKIDQATTDERQAREEIYATDQDCDAWRSAFVCDGIADRLRGYSSRPLSADRGGPGRGDDQGAGDPD